MNAAASAHVSEAPVTKNANFIGRWVGTSPGWAAISKKADGSCTGTSSFGFPSGFTACHVTGNGYAFVITYPGNYKSYTSDTITRNTVQGAFHDTLGYQVSYTFGRATHIATTTGLACGCTKTAFSCTATVRYNDIGNRPGAPTGVIKLAAHAGKLSRTSCTFAPTTKHDVASCAVVYTRAKHHTTAVTASYRGSQAFLPSAGSTTIHG